MGASSILLGNSLLVTHILLLGGVLHNTETFLLGGTFMFEEKENEEQDEIEELKTFTIADYVKLRREQRKQEQAEFESKLKVLQEKQIDSNEN